MHAFLYSCREKLARRNSRDYCGYYLDVACLIVLRGAMANRETGPVLTQRGTDVPFTVCTVTAEIAGATGRIRYTALTIFHHHETGNSCTHMKYLLALLIVILVSVSLVLFNSGEQEQPGDTPVTGLPWQIDKLPNGNTRVFGITLGQTTLGEAIELLGNDMDLAIIAAPGEAGSLEAYYSHYSAGPITGRLILIMDITPDELAALREREFHDRGTRRYHLHPDDLQAAFRAPVGIITFLPSFNLDEDIVQGRFGMPDEVIQVNEQQKHLLYPGKGLDLILNSDSKELLQYLQPQAFSEHRAGLQQQPAAGE
jgi:hypothetical protein